jgi:phosphate transport system substrate-binding protein
MKVSKRVLAAIVAASAFAGLGSVANASGPSTGKETITAGGATFPLNIVESCRAQYAGDSTANSKGHAINYTGVGSGTGRQNFYRNDYVFGMSDSLPSSTGDASRDYRASFVLVPMISGPIGVGYRLDNVKPEGAILKLAPETIAKIFAGQITKWDDAAIKADNPIAAKPSLEGLNKFVTVTAKAGKKAGTIDFSVNIKRGLVTSKTKNLIITGTDPTGNVATVYNKKPKTGITKISAKHTAGTEYRVDFDKTEVGPMSLEPTAVKLPPTPITVYYRKDTSGTTNNFANYLNKVIPTVWTKATNDAFTTAFPGTMPTDGSFSAQQGNDGVANGIMNKDGGIGYAEVSFLNERQAAGKNVQIGLVKNGANEWVSPSSSATATFVNAGTLVDSGAVTFDYATKTSGAYPISAISYALANTAANTSSGGNYKTPPTSNQNVVVREFVEFFLNTCAPATAELKGYAPITGAVLAKAKELAAKIAK